MIEKNGNIKNLKTIDEIFGAAFKVNRFQIRDTETI